MFHSFDKLLLISEGYPVYYGKGAESLEYFSSLRFIPKIPMNPAEFLLDLATGQVNDISVPEDLMVPQGQGTLDSEKAVVRVRTTTSKSPAPKFFVSSSLSTCVFIFMLVPTTQIQNSAGAKRKRRESSNNKSTRPSSSSYSG